MDFSELVPNALLAARGDAIVAVDREGIIRFWNPGAEHIIGHPAADAVGRSLDLIIPERSRRQHWAGCERTMQTGESRYGDGDLLSVPAIYKDGTTIYRVHHCPAQRQFRTGRRNGCNNARCDQEV